MAKGSEAGFDAICNALKDVGMNIPDEVTDYTGLVIAIKAGSGFGGGGGVGRVPPLPDDEEIEGGLNLSNGPGRSRRGEAAVVARQEELAKQRSYK